MGGVDYCQEPEKPALTGDSCWLFHGHYI